MFSSRQSRVAVIKPLFAKGPSLGVRLLVLVVLSAFALGVIVGVLGMVPRWWMHRSAARRAQAALPPTPQPAAPAVTPVAPSADNPMPPIHGI